MSVAAGDERGERDASCSMPSLSLGMVKYRLVKYRTVESSENRAKVSRAAGRCGRRKAIDICGRRETRALRLDLGTTSEKRFRSGSWEFVAHAPVQPWVAMTPAKRANPASS